jgi:hypothetical protein
MNFTIRIFMLLFGFGLIMLGQGLLGWIMIATWGWMGLTEFFTQYE